jgi:hypothetical protein
MESNMEASQQPKNRTPVIPLLGLYPKECTPEYDRATCTLIFIAALFGNSPDGP